MNMIRSTSALALALLLAACGEGEKAKPEGANVASVPASGAATQIYSGNGTVQSIAGDKVTIAHGPIESIGWPAMTMAFTSTPGMAESVQPGAQVDFSFRQDGGAFVLTALQPR